MNVECYEVLSTKNISIYQFTGKEKIETIKLQICLLIPSYTTFGKYTGDIDTVKNAL